MTTPASHDALGPRSSADALLESMERVRALAGQIVRQAADQDDLVQEAVVRALARPSTIVGESGPWVRRVVRNLAIDRQRSSARRQGRELSAVEGEMTQESTADSVARAESQRDLVDSVLQLPEPYRAVILARFFDGLPPREISKKLGVPVATVKKQQERGMALLRKELEGRYGQNGAWAVALLPILPKSVLRSLVAKGGGAGTLAFAPRWIALAFAMVTGVAVPAYLLRSEDLGAPENLPIAPLERSDGVAEVSEGAMRKEFSTQPRRVAEAPALDRAGTSTAADAGVLRTFTGRFVDEAGAPIAGVTARCCAIDDLNSDDTAFAGPIGRGSDAGVVFASVTARLDQPMVVDVQAPGHASATYRFRPDAERAEAILDVGRQTLYRTADLDVRVVDASGAVLSGWEMSYFHYGGGERLERGRAAVDPATGRATFRAIAAAEVEVIAEHPSGLEIHRPRRLLRPGDDNAVDLVYLGLAPERRIGVEVDWPSMARTGSAEPVEVQLLDGDGVSAVASLALDPGEHRMGFEDVERGHYFLSVEDPRFHAERVPVEPGQSAKLVLRGNARLALTVRDANGEVLAGHSVDLGPSGGAAAFLDRRGAGVALDGLVPGEPFVVRVTAPDGRQAISEVPALEPNETRVLDLTLGDGLTAIHVQAVRGREGEPVANAEVALFGGVLDAGSSQAKRAIEQLDGTTRAGGPKRLALGRTNDVGQVTLQVAKHEMGEAMTALVIDGDHALGRIVGGGVRVVLAARGAVSVRALGVPDDVPLGDAWPEGVALTLTWPESARGGRAPFGPGLVLEPQEGGFLGTEVAPEGPATIWLSLSDFNHMGRGTPLGGITGPVGYPVGSVNVRAGETVETEVDLGAVWPGRLEVVVRQAGRVITDAVVDLEPVGSHAHLPYPFGDEVDVSRVLSHLTDGSGRALFDRVPKGLWRIRVRDIEWLWAAGAGEIEIESGERKRVEVAVELAEADVTLVEASSGEPLRDTAVTIGIAPRRRVRRVTDADGKLRLQLGPGSYPVALDGREGGAEALLEWGAAGPVKDQLRLQLLLQGLHQDPHQGR
ncbi:ECF RNA polymerase sigma factor SigW [Planctomycetes bacterium Poly30]|uniref:ECF RNA polymerase sigma factor SigW n=1 Tax=Saltatorellus ferox TaxID=2528018 RepID=A0A518ELS8_9BACT|nr:ECF RNA polymerase sigma factor SigW [Planctomycetes bacterium Poly30]